MPAYPNPYRYLAACYAHMGRFDDAFAHSVKGTVLRAQNRYEEAIPEFETALSFNHNMAAALHELSLCKFWACSMEEAICLEEQAMRLSPRDPMIGWRYLLIGTVHLLQSRTDEAIVWLEKARSSVPAAPGVRSRLASAYGLKGETYRAAAELAEARRLSSDDRFSSLTRLRTSGGPASGYWGVRRPALCGRPLISPSA
jgi:tetratricopeptide (TPR) repeat protein